jgi:hypothetical protein
LAVNFQIDLETILVSERKFEDVLSAKIPRLSSPQCQESRRRATTSADRIEASCTVAFELVKLFVLAIQSLPKKKKSLKGPEFHVCQAVDQVVQTAQLFCIPHFKSWNGSLFKEVLMRGKPPKNG